MTRPLRYMAAAIATAALLYTALLAIVATHNDMWDVGDYDPTDLSEETP